jgi:hypothetical protein
MKVVIPKIGNTRVLCDEISKITGVDADKVIIDFLHVDYITVFESCLFSQK